MRKVKFLFFTLTLGLLWTIPLKTVAQSKENSKNKNAQLPSYPPNSTTEGTVTIEGKKTAYKTIAGVLPLLDKNEKDTTAKMSFSAYFKDGVTNLSNRPIMFLFNGGPGSSTLWLHMGSFGPKRVKIDSTTHTIGAPYQLIDNNYSLLDATDLVFIDAPGTGFGRVLKGKEKAYYGVDQDASAFAQFIQRFITQYNRWNSPKFLFGESYGTTRAAVLVNILQNKYSINMNGVIFLSQILDFNNSIDRTAHDIAYQLGLPTFAATAWYHKKLPNHHESLEHFLKEVEAFAMSEYAIALNKGSTISETEFNTIAKQLHQYTGLPVAYIKKANLRIDGGEFRQQLLGKENMNTGRLDTRFSGPAIDPLSQRSYYDPQSQAISGPYVSLLNDYMRNVLKYGKNMTYHYNIYGKTNWDFKHHGSQSTLNVMNDLSRAMKKNPKLQVMLNAGYYDLATTYYEGVYELQHLNIPKSLQKNIHYSFYESGHMVYIHLPSLKALRNNVKSFIENNCKQM